MADTPVDRFLDGLLRDGVEPVISRLSEEILADEEGVDYLCTHIDRLLNPLTRVSTLLFIQEDVISLLVRDRKVVSESTSKSEDGDIVLMSYTGSGGRPAIAISEEHLEYSLGSDFIANYHVRCKSPFPTCCFAPLQNKSSRETIQMRRV